MEPSPTPSPNPPDRPPSRDVGVDLRVADAAFLQEALAERGIRSRLAPAEHPDDCRLLVDADRVDEARALVEESEEDERAALAARPGGGRARGLAAGTLVFLLSLRYGVRFLGNGTLAVGLGLLLAIVTFGLLGGEEAWPPAPWRD